MAAVAPGRNQNRALGIKHALDQRCPAKLRVQGHDNSADFSAAGKGDIELGDVREKQKNAVARPDAQ